MRGESIIVKQLLQKAKDSALLAVEFYNKPDEPIVKQIEAPVDKILETKNQNPSADISHLEKQIDQLVYELYGLTQEEIKIIENS